MVGAILISIDSTATFQSFDIAALDHFCSSDSSRLLPFCRLLTLHPCSVNLSR